VSDVGRVPLWHHPCPRGRGPGRQIPGGLFSHSGRRQRRTQQRLRQRPSPNTVRRTKSSTRSRRKIPIGTRTSSSSARSTSKTIGGPEGEGGKPRRAGNAARDPAPKPEAPAITPPPVVLAPPSAAPAPETTNATPPPLRVRSYHHDPCGSRAAENEQVKQLNAELERARQQIQQLQAARDELNAKLQEQLSKVAPTQTNQQIEDLLKTNQVLAAQLAAAQTEAAEARERAACSAPGANAAPAPPAQSPELAQLRTELAQTRGELQQTKEELQQTRVELDTTKNRWRNRRRTTPSCATPTMRSFPSLRMPTSDWPPPRLPATRTTKSSVSCAKRTRSCGSLPSARPPRHLPAGKAKKAPMARRFPSFAAGVLISAPRRRPRNNLNPETATPASAMEESGRGKLVATLTSPKKAETPPAPAAVPPANTQTNIPPKPVVTVKKTPTATDAALTSTNAPTGFQADAATSASAQTGTGTQADSGTGANTRLDERAVTSYECTAPDRGTQTGTSRRRQATRAHGGLRRTRRRSKHRHRRTPVPNAAPRAGSRQPCRRLRRRTGANRNGTPAPARRRTALAKAGGATPPASPGPVVAATTTTAAASPE
jgi:flagellar biosynthesis chaperone FliJ